MGKARRTRQTREQERKRARMRRMLIATGTAVAVVIALIAVQQVTSSGSSRPDPSNLAGVADVQTQFDGVTEKSGTIGNPGANVTITEFGDLRCPICRQFDADVTPQLISNFVRTGKAKMQFRAWPILGANSVTAAQAAYAAQKQNALWPYATLAYLNQGDENVAWFTPAIARSIAAGVGLDIAKFDRDRQSAAAKTQIAKVNGDASTLGLQGTPSIRVSGPKGTITVAADYNAIASGVQKVGGAAA
jgi:protein-disulfide isomerase